MANNILNYLIKATWAGRSATKDAAKDIGQLGDAGEQAAGKTDRVSKSTTNLGAGLSKLLAAGVIVSVTKQLLDFGLNAADVAASTEEKYKKFETVFGEFAEGTERELDRIAESTRTSEHALIGYASTIQDTLVPMGLARGEAADLRTQLVALGMDLAAFNDMPVDEAMQRLQGTLVGSHENALAFGVVINENTLKAELAAQGWDRLAGAQLEAAKVQARINLLMAGTTDAAGTAAEEADEYAGAQRDMAAALEDLNIVIGQTLLPTLTPMLLDAADAAKKAAEETAGYLDWRQREQQASMIINKLYEEGAIGFWEYQRMMNTGFSEEWAQERDALVQKTLEEQAAVEDAAYYYGVYAQASYDATKQTEETTEAIEAQISSVNPVAGLILRSERAWAAYAETQVDVAEAVAETQRQVSGSSIQAWIDNADDAADTSLDLEEGLWGAVAAADGTPEAFANAALAAGKLTREQAEAYLKTEALRAKMKELGESVANGDMGWDEALQQIEDFEAGLMALPDSHEVMIVVADEYARQAIDEFRALLDSVPDAKTINFDATWSYGSMSGSTGAGGTLPEARNPGGYQAPPDGDEGSQERQQATGTTNNYFNTREAAAVGLALVQQQRRARIGL